MRSLLVSVVAAALMAGCTATTEQAARLQVYTEHDETVEFSTWSSFRMASAQAADTTYTRYPIYEKMVRTALVQELTERGYQQAQDGDTDFRVAFELILRGGSAASSVDSSHGVNTDPTMSRGSTPTSTLIVRMLHPRTSTVLWQGRLSGFEVPSVAPETAFERAVWRVLVEFPPITG
jgi:hypothetical protein